MLEVSLFTSRKRTCLLLYLESSDPHHLLSIRQGKPRGIGFLPGLAGLAARSRQPQLDSWVSRLEQPGIVEHALNIHHHGRLIAHRPGVMAGGEQGHFARMTIELVAVVHTHAEHARDLILEVGRFTALCPGEGLDRGCPAPTWLKDGPADGCAADAILDAPIEELRPSSTSGALRRSPSRSSRWQRRFTCSRKMKVNSGVSNIASFTCQ